MSGVFSSVCLTRTTISSPHPPAFLGSLRLVLKLKLNFVVTKLNAYKGKVDKVNERNNVTDMFFS